MLLLQPGAREYAIRKYIINVLSYREKSDTYYCMLFNDEVHTYEQVIYTLQKAVNCTQKEAIGFATTVDRDVSDFIILMSHNKFEPFITGKLFWEN